jgi:serine/threonine protein kinase
MKAAFTSTMRGVERLYAASTADPAFELVLGAHQPADEEDLAYLIAFDGRVRIDLGLPVSLRRYLEALPELPAQEVALDAALEVTLRAMSGSSRPDPAAIETLVAAHPELAGAIREAGLLAEAVTSTASLRERLTGAAPRALPADFGPALASGGPRYELRQVLGRGSSGEVFLAVDRQLSEADHPALVAVKIIACGMRTARQRERLVEEATKARRVIHDHVARVLDRGVSADGEDYIVYEYIEGGDLDAWLGGHPAAGQRERCSLLAKVARGVHAAHSAGLVHCDLKPANILVKPDGEPKVADFGIAVRVGESDSDSADGSGLLGNLAFISPERFRREPGAFGVPSDVYALGGLLSYVLTGVLPNGSSAGEIESAHLDRRAGGEPHPRGAIDDPVLDRIRARAMADNAADRYVSAAALADDVESWTRLEPIRWMRPSPPARLRLWSRRRPVVAGLAASLLVATALGSAGVCYSSSRAATKGAQLAEIESRVAQGRQVVKAIIQKAGALGKLQVPRDALFRNLFLEALRGPAVPGVFDGPPQRRAERIQHMRQWVAAAKSLGRDRDIEVLLVTETLGLWLLDDGQARESERVLGELLPRMSWMPADDPLVAEARLLHAAAVVQMGAQGESLERSRAVLADAPRFLRSTLASQGAQDSILKACILGGVPCELEAAATLPAAPAK